MTNEEIDALRRKWAGDQGVAVKDLLKVLDVLQRLPAQAEYGAMFENLTSVQARCTELLLEARTLRDENRKLKERVRQLEEGINLPGFTCRSCGLFTGFEREIHTQCRRCGTPRPT